MRRLLFTQQITKSVRRADLILIHNIKRSFCNKTNVDLSQLKGVSYLNQRIDDLRKVENSDTLILKELRNLRQAIGSLNINESNRDILHNFSILNRRIDILEQNDEKIVKKIDEIVSKIGIVNVENVSPRAYDSSDYSTYQLPKQTLKDESISKNDTIETQRVHHSSYNPSDYSTYELPKRTLTNYSGLQLIGSIFLLFATCFGGCMLSNIYYELRKVSSKNLLNEEKIPQNAMNCAEHGRYCEMLAHAKAIYFAATEQNYALFANTNKDYLEAGLEWAICQEKLNPKAIEFLIKRGARIHGRYYGNAWKRAIDIGNTEAISLLIDFGANIQIDNNYGIMKCAKRGHTEAFKLLALKGAPIDVHQNQPLILASANGHNDIVVFLCEKKVGQDKTFQNVHYDKAIQIAARNGHYDVIKTLNSFGANYKIYSIQENVIKLQKNKI